MTEVFVYRVENKKSQGMYTGSGKNLNTCPEYQSIKYYCDASPKHPEPNLDLMIKSIGGWLFGFESLNALYEWLYEKDWIVYLRDNGYYIQKYSVYDLLKQGQSQLVFEPMEKVSQSALSIYGPAEFI